MVASWFTLTHNKGLAQQFNEPHGKLFIVVKLEIVPLHLMRQGGPLLFVKPQGYNYHSRICAVANTIPYYFQLQLHIFIFDEHYNQLQSWASGINLVPWYNPGVSITAMCIVQGSEELLLIGTDLVARIYSLLTQQFRFDFLSPTVDPYLTICIGQLL